MPRPFLYPVPPRLSLRGAESSTRRSNPLNSAAQEGTGQRRGHARIPEGIATSCLTALLPRAAGDVAQENQGTGSPPNSWGDCRVVPDGTPRKDSGGHTVDKTSAGIFACAALGRVVYSAAAPGAGAEAIASSIIFAMSLCIFCAAIWSAV